MDVTEPVVRTVGGLVRGQVKDGVRRRPPPTTRPAWPVPGGSVTSGTSTASAYST